MNSSIKPWMFAIATVALAATVPACAVEGADESEDVEAVDEEGDVASSADAISGRVTVGATLRTTIALNLRSGPGTGYRILVGMPSGARVTAVASSPSYGFYKVKYGSITGWASGTYLRLASSSTSTTSVRIAGPTVLWHVQNFANRSCAAYGCPYTVGTYVGHQPTASRAIDMMMSVYGTWPSSTNVTRGTNHANYAVRNAGTHKVLYAIWRQRINTLDGRGWRWMADRGSLTQNHYDHVHVSFKS
jgi:uncharacterized protein YgiM (DUF1202 family)